MTDTSLAAVAQALGYNAPAPTWQIDESRTPLNPALFGKDHWSTLAYIETRIVDYRGILSPDHMRTDADRHPFMQAAKTRQFGFPSGNTDKYPTKIKASYEAGSDGKFGTLEIANHDDWDCIEDLIAAGLVTVQMPVADGAVFRDVTGKVVRERAGNTVIEPGFVTGLTEHDLMLRASFQLTDEGQRVAGELRAHKGNGGNFHSFVPSTPGQ